MPVIAAKRHLLAGEIVRAAIAWNDGKGGVPAGWYALVRHAIDDETLAYIGPCKKRRQAEELIKRFLNDVGSKVQ